MRWVICKSAGSNGESVNLHPVTRLASDLGRTRQNYHFTVHKYICMVHIQAAQDTATRVAGNKKGNGEGGKGNDNGNKEGDGDQRRQHGQQLQQRGWQAFDGGNDGDSANDTAACTTTGERGVMVAIGHGLCVCFGVCVETTKIGKWIFGWAKVPISTQRLGINKWVICPLSNTEKQGLAPQDIVPPKLVAKKRIQKVGQEPEIQNRGPPPLKSQTTNQYSLNFSCHGPEHARQAKPRAGGMRGNIYNIYVPLLLPLMLCISGTTIKTGNKQARQFVNVSCLRQTNYL